MGAGQDRRRVCACLFPPLFFLSAEKILVKQKVASERTIPQEMVMKSKALPFTSFSFWI